MSTASPTGTAARWRLALLLVSGAGALNLADRGPGDLPAAGGPNAARAAPGELITQGGAQGVANAAGCALVGSEKKERDLNRLGGVYPVQDFKDMLGHDFAYREGGPQFCQDKIAKSRWCTRTTTTQRPYLGPDSSTFQQIRPYLENALEGTDTSLPLTIAIIDIKMNIAGRFKEAWDNKNVQLLNFICGWERLGLLENRSAAFVTTPEVADELRRLNPRLRVLYHPLFKEAVELIGEHTGSQYKNRMWKLMAAQMLLNLERDLFLTDLDVYFVRDPLPMLHAAAQHEGLEFAAMEDGCWLELNSGLLYYRSTTTTKRMVEISLMTRKDNEQIAGCTDNDQYLLNCGFAHAAAFHGLRYKMLPKTGFQFGFSLRIGGDNKCKDALNSPPHPASTYLGDELPYVWHTAGFSAGYEKEIDKFAALGLIDVDGATGRCLAGTRGTSGDAAAFVNVSARSCYTGEGGILHNNCYGACSPSPVFAQKLRSDLGRAFS